MPIQLRKDNWDAALIGFVLGAVAVPLLHILGVAAVLFGVFLEFVLPIPVCMRARSNLLLLSLIPNAVVNSWFVFIQAPKSGYWAGWRNEWELSLSIFGFGVAASLLVASVTMLCRKRVR